MNTLSALNLMPSTKDQVEAFSNSIINEIKSGSLNALEFKTRAKFIENCLSKIDKSVKEEFLNEASKHGKDFEYKGFRISQIESGVTYDFSNDAEWVYLSNMLKQRETFLKSLKEPLEVLDSETGEIIKSYPPIKRSTTTYKFSMK